MLIRPTIRAENPADVDAIHRVHRLAFPTDLEARLVDELRIGGNLTISVVAEIDGQVVGHAALSPITINGAPHGLGLAPVAVLPAKQRIGVGGMLIRHALEVCLKNGVPLVVVLGAPDYYSRFGFIPASSYELTDTYGGGEAFQALSLSAVAPPPGIVRYASEFNIFESTSEDAAN